MLRFDAIRGFKTWYRMDGALIWGLERELAFVVIRNEYLPRLEKSIPFGVDAGKETGAFVASMVVSIP